MKRFYTITITFLLLASLLCGCRELPGSLNPTDGKASSTEQSSDNGQGRDDLPHDSKDENYDMIWNIPSDAKLLGTASNWSFRFMDCHTLWEEIKERFFPTAQVTVLRESPLWMQAETHLGTLEISAEERSLSIYAIEVHDATQLATDIADMLAQAGGLTVAAQEPEAFNKEVLHYAFCLDGILINCSASDLFSSYISVSEYGELNITMPIIAEEALQSYVLQDYLTMEEASLLCQLDWQSKGWQRVGEVNAYEPMYVVDETEQCLRIAWLFRGQHYPPENLNDAHPLYITLDALTGEPIV